METNRGPTRVAQIKRGQCSFFRRSKHVLANFDNFGRWNNSSFTHFEKHICSW